MLRLSSSSSFCKLLVKCTATNNNINSLKPLQVATICRKEEIDSEIIESKPKPFPWEKYGYSQLHSFLGVDRAINRFDENTCLITIEGNIGVGKTTFGKALAEALGARYFPEPDVTYSLIRPNGFDFRTLNYKLPEACHYVDSKLFWLNPNHKAVGGFEISMYYLRCWEYINCLAHVLSTGQGVVSDRSPWSSLAFQTAAHKMKLGRCGKSFMKFCQHFRQETLPELLRPHYVIYLDAPAEVCLERVKKRGIEHEVNSPAMSKEYLDHIEFTYKDYILPELEAHAEVLVYDWTDPPAIDSVIEDMAEFDVHSHEKGEKAEDWRFSSEIFYDQVRQYYTTDRNELYEHFYQELFWAPDLLLTPEESDHLKSVMNVYLPIIYDNDNPKTFKDWLSYFFQPDFCRGTYLERKDLRFFGQLAPRRPTISS